MSIRHTVLNVEIQDVDVSYDVIQAPTKEDAAEVAITRVEFRGFDLTGLLKRRELATIAVQIEDELEREFAQPPKGSCL